MRAAVVAEPDAASRLVLAPVADPSPEPGQLVLRVARAGVCGTDVHLARTPFAVMPGVVLGHEFCGEVAEWGKGVDGWSVGDRVCTAPYTTCGACSSCAADDPMGCAHVRQIGSGDMPGAFAEYVRVGASQSRRVPEGLSLDAAALVEPVAFARHAARVSRVGAGDRVLVVGAGPIGLAVSAWARHLGAARVVVADRLASRRALAGVFGAGATLDAGDDAAMLGVADVVGGPPDLVFECVGAPGLLQDCVQIVRRRGRVVVAGACMTGDTLVPAMACLKEVEMRFLVSCSARDFGAALEVVSAGVIPVEAMVTDRVSLDELPAAFAALDDPGVRCKVLVKP